MSQDKARLAYVLTVSQLFGEAPPPSTLSGEASDDARPHKSGSSGGGEGMGKEVSVPVAVEG